MKRVRQGKAHSLNSLLKTIKLVVFDFDGVMTDNAVYVDQEGKESVRCWRGDGIGLSQMKKVGLDLLVLSTEKNPVVTARCKKLNIACIQGCDDKLTQLKKILHKKTLTLSQVAYMGNDINDEECLRSVALPIVVADAHPSVKPLAKLVTQARGGYGAVREIGDLFMKACTT